jgi:hypothetical protein
MATLAEMAAKVAEGKANGAKVRAARAARPVVHASTCEAPVATVWRVCAAVLAQDEGATRSDLHAACEAAGVATFTARTQTQAFLKALRAAQEVAE